MSEHGDQEAHLLLTQGLVDAVKRGDAARFSDLYTRVSPALQVWAELRMPRWVRHKSSPDDLVQEVWVRALVKFVDFDPERAPFRSWLFGMARLVLTEILRQNVGRQHDSPSVSDLNELPDDVTSLFRQVARKGVGEALIDKLRELDDEERKLLLLRGFEGGSHESVARELDTSPAAVRKKWQRLRDRLELMGLAKQLLDDQ